MNLTNLPALLLVLASIAVVISVQQIVGRASRDHAAMLWSKVACRLVVVVAPACVASAALETVWPEAFHAGRHLFLDVTGAADWSMRTCFLLALALPFALWIGLVGLGLRGASLESGASVSRHVLTGFIGLEGSRRRLLLWALPLGLMALATLPRLGGGPGAYPAAPWALLVLLTASLFGLARQPVLSRASGPRERDDSSSDTSPARSTATTRSWSQTLAAGGVPTRPLARWDGRTRRAPGRAAVRRFEHELRRRGAQNVAPELIEAASELMAWSDDAGARTRVVSAPDGCGQEETVAVIGQLLGRRYGTHTLVVVAHGAGALAMRLARWSPPEHVVALDAGTELPPSERLWVVDADVLSESLLPRFREAQMLSQLGCVVWWDVHAWSGLASARLWALSRRLHRLGAAHGLADLRTLAFLRRATHPDAQESAYIQGLLPVTLDGDARVDVPMEGPRAIAIHHLPAALSSNHAAQLAQSATVASLGGGWTTALELSGETQDEGVAGRQALRAVDGGDGLRDDAVDADARIRQLQPADVLALPALFSQGGRGTSPGEDDDDDETGYDREAGTHRVGLLVSSHEPYLRHLMSRLERREAPGVGTATLGTARRLIAIRASGSFLRRQILLALGDMPDTREGLLNTFLHEKALVRDTLEAIAREGNLVRRPVRSLDAEQRLVMDHQYRSRRPEERRSHASTGPSSSIEVRDVGAARSPVARIDRERLAIEAYPHRVFMADGQRYRVAEWSSWEAVLARGHVACQREDLPYETWRRRHAAVWDVVPRGVPVTVGGHGRAFRRVVADLSYEEEVTGVVQVAGQLSHRPSRSPTPAHVSRPEVRLLDEPIRKSFPSRGLLLDFGCAHDVDDHHDASGSVALCEALRHVLPVHLGVEDGDLELVPLWGEETDDGLRGVALIELHAGNQGLIEALEGEHDLFSRLLGRTRDWLRELRERGGLASVLDTPAARAAAADRLPDPAAALRLLERAV